MDDNIRVLLSQALNDGWDESSQQHFIGSYPHITGSGI